MATDETIDPASEWVALVDPAFAEVAREVRLLAAVVPTGRSASGRVSSPRLARANPPCRSGRTPASNATEALRAAAELGRRLERMPASPVHQLYVNRLRELTLEAEMVDAVGTARFSRLAQDRFPPEATAGEAASLASTWLEAIEGLPQPTFGSDSTIAIASCRMRAELVRLDLRFDVVPVENLLALAAIGDERIWIAAGRTVTVEDVERTVTHELHGHALPRARAASMSLGNLKVGTARGSDDQEGLALCLEERGGYLGVRRKRELAGRHLAATNMAAGRRRSRTRSQACSPAASPEDSVRMAERVYRGGDGRSHGLGRERVYLESYVRARKHVSRRPQDMTVLSSGQVCLDAARTLLPFVRPDSTRGAGPASRG